MSVSAAELVELLDLEQIDVNLFRGRQPQTDRQRVFGGQVAAQALVAGIRTVDPAYVVHSLHSYFLLPGDTAVPIVYDVERLRDGRSFATRRVVARQHGRPIYFQTASFQRDEEGLEHQDQMPDVPEPAEGLRPGRPDAAQRQRGCRRVRQGVGGARGALRRHLAVRPAAPTPTTRRRPGCGSGSARGSATTRRSTVAAFTYASDITLLGAALAAHDVTPADVQMASLDHTIWFHRPFRVDEWWLYDMQSPSAQGAAGLALARVFAQDGRLVATVAQEGLIRLRRRDRR